MGTQFSLNSPTAMKLFVVLALVAAAEPEADPYLTYGGLYGGVYGGYLGHRLTGYGFPYTPYVHAIGKREAEAEPEADADALFYSRLGYTGLGYTGLGLTYGGHHLTGYGYGCPYARTVLGGYHAIGKREAEAEPEADADADAYYYSSLGYTGLGYTGLTYGGLYGGHHLTGYGYPSYTRSVLGYHAIGKREAEAAPEADADALYYSRLGYGGLGYYGGYGYAGYPYARTYAGLHHGYGGRVWSYGK